MKQTRVDVMSAQPASPTPSCLTELVIPAPMLSLPGRPFSRRRKRGKNRLCNAEDRSNVRSYNADQRMSFRLIVHVLAILFTS